MNLKKMNRNAEGGVINEKKVNFCGEVWIHLSSFPCVPLFQLRSFQLTRHAMLEAGIS
jgi:hypothetical protein